MLSNTSLFLEKELQTAQLPLATILLPMGIVSPSFLYEHQQWQGVESKISEQADRTLTAEH